MSLGLAVIVVACLMGFAGCLVAVETAILHIRRARAVVLVEESSKVLTNAAAGEVDGRSTPSARSAGQLLMLLDDRVRSLAVVQLIVLVCRMSAAGLLAGVVTGRSGAGWAVAAVGILLLVGYILTDVVPRAVSLRAVDVVVLRAASVVAVLDHVAPVRWLARGLVAIAERLLPRSLRSGPPVVSEEELLAVADRALASEAIDPEEHELIESVIAFGDTLVREVMVPRPDMGCVAAGLTVAEAMAEAARSGFSRLPVTGEGLDEVVGVVLAKDLMRAHLDQRDGALVGDLARLPRFVPETKQADDLLREMQRDRYHLAVVVDEYGGTAGLVTMEDLLEEVVGEIVDEFDTEEPLSEEIAGGGVRVHGRMPIDELTDLLGVTLPDGDWDTVGGMLFDALGHVPGSGEVVLLGGRSFTVEQVEGRRITRVRISGIEAASGPLATQ
ncbi:MAG: hypothetical protein CL467_02715 [Acidimicrobiaceae bacterium]|nr:hypothetical protein [Acidimicrobiaceae bacterium]